MTKLLSGRIGKQVLVCCIKKSQNSVVSNCKSPKTTEATPGKAGSVHDRSSAESEWKRPQGLKTLLNTCRCSRVPFKNTFSSIPCQIPSLLVGAGTRDWPEALRHPLLFLLITRVFMALLSIPGTLLSPVEMMSYCYLG